VPQDGDYAVYVHIPNDTSLAGADYKVTSNGGSTTTPDPGIFVNQGQNAGQWVRLGGAAASFYFKAGAGQSVSLTPPGALVAADAVKITRDDSGDTAAVPESYSYTYDADGNRVGSADLTPGAQSNDYPATFDQLDRLTQLQATSSGTVQHTVGYTYDAEGRALSQSFDARIDSYAYDPLGRLAQVVNKQGSVDPGLTTSYTYTPTGQPATETKGNGDKVTAVYNSDGTLASGTEVTGAGATVDSHQLTYDANNNVATDATSLMSADDGSTLNRTATRTYSPNNQVTTVRNAPDGKQSQDYSYDSAGNVSLQTVNGVQAEFIYDRGRMYATTNLSAPVGIPTGSYQYDTMGRLHSVTSGTITGNVLGVSQQYDYDSFDNILKESSTSGTTTSPTTNATDYTYDTLNRPLTESLNQGGASSQTSTFDYLGVGRVVTDETITGASAATKVYDYSPTGERLGMINTYAAGGPGAIQSNFYSYSPHSDVEALTDTTGHTTATYGYTAYGADDNTLLDTGVDKNSVSATNPTLPYNAYRFNSARIDTATSNLDMGARSYDPNINRFLTRDVYSGASADQAMAADPYNGNGYGFAGGNPVSNVELNGHDWKSILGIGLVVGAVVGGIACTALTDGACLLAIGSAAAEGSAFGVEGAVSSAMFSAIFEGGAAVAGSLGIGGTAGGIAAGAVALEESASADLGAADAGAADTSAAVDEADSGASDLGGCLASVGGESFTADTQVRLADGGTRAISALRPGDRVKSADPATGKDHDSTVSDVMVNHDNDLYDLTVHTADGDHVIHTTSGHLFYDRTAKRWVKASELHAGDELDTGDGTTATAVSGATAAVASGDMWDLTIPGDHDFFVVVGDTQVLVHNAGKKCGVAPPGHVYRGGQYKDLGDPATGRNVSGTEINHMPASQANSDVFGIPEGQGLAIQMDEADHVLTESWGSSHAGMLHRAHQMFLLRQGRLTEALDMDISNVRNLFGTKYDGAIEEMRGSIASYLIAINKAGVFQGTFR
jgi:RHS repeat-associated protein